MAAWQGDGDARGAASGGRRSCHILADGRECARRIGWVARDGGCLGVSRVIRRGPGQWESGWLGKDRRCPLRVQGRGCWGPQGWDAEGSWCLETITCRPVKTKAAALCSARSPSSLAQSQPNPSHKPQIQPPAAATPARFTCHRKSPREHGTTARLTPPQHLTCTRSAWRPAHTSCQDGGVALARAQPLIRGGRTAAHCQSPRGACGGGARGGGACGRAGCGFPGSSHGARGAIHKGAA